MILLVMLLLLLIAVLGLFLLLPLGWWIGTVLIAGLPQLDQF